MRKPTITLREYDNQTGEFVRSTPVLDYGIVLSGNSSGIRVVDFVITGVSAVSNFDITLTNSDGLEVSPSTATVINNVADDGNFGIEINTSFIKKTSLGSFFSALDKEISVPMRIPVVTNYISLNILPGTFESADRNVEYNISFDFIPLESSSSSSFSRSSSSCSCSCSCSFSSSSNSISSSSFSSCSSSDSICCKNTVGVEPPAGAWSPNTIHTTKEAACAPYPDTYWAMTFLYNGTVYYTPYHKSIRWFLNWTDTHCCNWAGGWYANIPSRLGITVQADAESCRSEIIDVPFVTRSYIPCSSSSSSCSSWDSSSCSSSCSSWDSSSCSSSYSSSSFSGAFEYRVWSQIVDVSRDGLYTKHPVLYTGAYLTPQLISLGEWVYGQEAPYTALPPPIEVGVGGKYLFELKQPVGSSVINPLEITNVRMNSISHINIIAVFGVVSQTLTYTNFEGINDVGLSTGWTWYYQSESNCSFQRRVPAGALPVDGPPQNILNDCPAASSSSSSSCSSSSSSFSHSWSSSDYSSSCSSWVSSSCSSSCSSWVSSSSSSYSCSSSFSLSSESISSNRAISSCPPGTPCGAMIIRFKTYNIPDKLTVTDNTGTILNTGFVSTRASYNTYNINAVCPVEVCVSAPLAGTRWVIDVTGCNFTLNQSGGQVNSICWTNSSSSSLSSSSCSSSCSSWDSSSCSCSSSLSPVQAIGQCPPGESCGTMTIKFKTYTIPDRLTVTDNTGSILDTGSISTYQNYNTYIVEAVCPVEVCVSAPLAGTAWIIDITGCDFTLNQAGGQVSNICWTNSSSSSMSLAPSPPSSSNSSSSCSSWVSSNSSSCSSSCSSSSCSCSSCSSSSSSGLLFGYAVWLAQWSCLGDGAWNSPQFAFWSPNTNGSHFGNWVTVDISSPDKTCMARYKTTQLEDTSLPPAIPSGPTEACFNCDSECNGCLPQLTGKYNVSFSGLDGEFQSFDGSHSMPSIDLGGCTWTKTTPDGVIMLMNVGVVWKVRIIVASGCTITWNGSTNPCSPTAAYGVWLSCGPCDCISSTGAIAIVS